MTNVAAVAGIHDTYGYLKPQPTLSAVVAAVCVTSYFSRIQARTAQRQADIVHDLLRYKICRVAQELIREIAIERKHVEISTQQMNNAIIRLRILDEALFFFSNDICKIFHEIYEDIETVVVETRALQRQPERESRANRAAKITAAEKRLRDRL